MKIKKFVIQYHYSDGLEVLSSSLYDSFDDALSQLVYIKENPSSVLDNCDGILIKCIEFDL